MLSLVVGMADIVYVAIGFRYISETVNNENKENLILIALLSYEYISVSKKDQNKV